MRYGLTVNTRMGHEAAYTLRYEAFAQTDGNGRVEQTEKWSRGRKGCYLCVVKAETAGSDGAERLALLHSPPRSNGRWSGLSGPIEPAHAAS